MVHSEGLIFTDDTTTMSYHMVQARFQRREAISIRNANGTLTSVWEVWFNNAAVLPGITADKGHAINLDEISEQFRAGNKVSEISENPFVSDGAQVRFNERMRGVAIDMVRLGYI